MSAELFAAKRETDRADQRTRGRCIPCKITAVNGETVNVMPLLPQLNYQDGIRTDAAPMEFEEVRYGSFGGLESYIHIPPQVGMIGFLVVTDFDVGDLLAGAVIVDNLAGRSSGYFVPMAHSEYLDHIEIFFKGSKVEITEGDIIMTPASGLVKVNGSLDVSGNADIGGTMTAQADAIGGGISLRTHIHLITIPTPGTPVTPPVA